MLAKRREFSPRITAAGRAAQHRPPWERSGDVIAERQRRLAVLSADVEAVRAKEATFAPRINSRPSTPCAEPDKENQHPSRAKCTTPRSVAEGAGPRQKRRPLAERADSKLELRHYFSKFASGGKLGFAGLHLCLSAMGLFRSVDAQNPADVDWEKKRLTDKIWKAMRTGAPGPDDMVGFTGFAKVVSALLVSKKPRDRGPAGVLQPAEAPPDDAADDDGIEIEEVRWSAPAAAPAAPPAPAAVPAPSASSARPSRSVSLSAPLPPVSEVSDTPGPSRCTSPSPVAQPSQDHRMPPQVSFQQRTATEMARTAERRAMLLAAKGQEESRQCPFRPAVHDYVPPTGAPPRRERPLVAEPTDEAELSQCTFAPQTHALPRAIYDAPAPAPPGFDRTVARLAAGRKQERKRFEEDLRSSSTYRFKERERTTEPRPFSFETEKRLRQKPLLYLDVDLPGGAVSRLAIHEGDDPTGLAERFAREHGLDGVLAGRLRRIIAENIRQHSAAQERGRTARPDPRKQTDAPPRRHPSTEAPPRRHPSTEAPPRRQPSAEARPRRQPSAEAPRRRQAQAEAPRQSPVSRPRRGADPLPSHSRRGKEMSPEAMQRRRAAARSAALAAAAAAAIDPIAAPARSTSARRSASAGSRPVSIRSTSPIRRDPPPPPPPADVLSSVPTGYAPPAPPRRQPVPGVPAAPPVLSPSRPAPPPPGVGRMRHGMLSEPDDAGSPLRRVAAPLHFDGQPSPSDARDDRPERWAGPVVDARPEVAEPMEQWTEPAGARPEQWTEPAGARPERWAEPVDQWTGRAEARPEGGRVHEDRWAETALGGVMADRLARPEVDYYSAPPVAEAPPAGVEEEDGARGGGDVDSSDSGGGVELMPDFDAFNDLVVDPQGSLARHFEEEEEEEEDVDQPQSPTPAVQPSPRHLGRSHSLPSAHRAGSELHLAPEEDYGDEEPSLHRRAGDPALSTTRMWDPVAEVRKAESFSSTPLSATPAPVPEPGDSPHPRPLIDWQLLHQASPSRVDVARVASAAAPQPQEPLNGFDTLMWRARNRTSQDFSNAGASRGDGPTVCSF